MEPNTVTIPEKRYEELKTIEECFKKAILILISQYSKEFADQKKESHEPNTIIDKVKYLMELERYIEERLFNEGLTARGVKFRIDHDPYYLNIKSIYAGDLYKGIEIQLYH